MLATPRWFLLATPRLFLLATPRVSALSVARAFQASAQIHSVESSALAGFPTRRRRGKRVALTVAWNGRARKATCVSIRTDRGRITSANRFHLRACGAPGTALAMVPSHDVSRHRAPPAPPCALRASACAAGARCRHVLRSVERRRRPRGHEPRRHAQGDGDVRWFNRFPLTRRPRSFAHSARSRHGSIEHVGTTFTIELPIADEPVLTTSDARS